MHNAYTHTHTQTEQKVSGEIRPVNENNETTAEKDSMRKVFGY